MREIQSLFALNRGLVSELGLARADVKRIALAAQVQDNWMPRVLGAASLRVGRAYLGGMYGNNAARMVPFVFSTSDTSLLEFTSGAMRVWISDSLLTRPSVATAITNGTFPTDLTGWTNADEAGATSSWVAPNYMQLVGDGTDRAIREQAVTCSTPNVEHALRIVVARGPVSVRVGSTSGGDEYVTEATLQTGTHSLAFTPTGTFYVRFFSALQRKVWVSQCTIESAGVVVLPTPWTASDLQNIRSDQSADVVYVACAGKQQRRIERRGTRPGGRSWSVVLYQSDDGPFRNANVGPIAITASGTSGNITLTASKPLFKSTHVGALFAIQSEGQIVTTTTSVAGTNTSTIRVTGIGPARSFTIVVSGDASASTVKLQRSFDNATWADVGGTYLWTADVTTSYLDGLDNQIVYYRLQLSARVAPDTVTMTLSIGSGSAVGVVRVTDYSSSTSVGAEVLSSLGGTTAVTTWQEGSWSDYRGWPTCVKLHEGRMWWAGQNGIFGSVSDAYSSFDPNTIGDAGTINRTIGSGPVDTINWLASLKGLILGAEGAEWTARASSLDEPLTPTNFNLKESGTQGSAAVEAVKVDQSCLFVNRSATKLFDVSFDIKSYDYLASDVTQIVPEVGRPSIVRVVVQRMPDTRLHCVRSDGTVAVYVMDKTEEVTAWVTLSGQGFIEDAVVLPAQTGNLDDQVYYVVRYTIGGTTVRYLEKWAQELECRGDQTLCKLADAHVLYSGGPTKVITGLSHLEGMQVVVWADGQDVGTNDTVTPWVQRYTVSGGQITLSSAVSSAVVGIGYSGRFQSAKLGTLGEASPLNQQKKIGHIGLILAHTHPRGIQFGPSFDVLDDMPLIEDGALIGTATETEYDQNLIEFPGTWTTDARVCLVANAPRPCTALGVTLDMVRYS